MTEEAQLGASHLCRFAYVPNPLCAHHQPGPPRSRSQAHPTYAICLPFAATQPNCSPAPHPTLLPAPPPPRPPRIICAGDSPGRRPSVSPSPGRSGRRLRCAQSSPPQRRGHPVRHTPWAAVASKGGRGGGGGGGVGLISVVHQDAQGPAQLSNVQMGPMRVHVCANMCICTRGADLSRSCSLVSSRFSLGRYCGTGRGGGMGE